LWLDVEVTTLPTKSQDALTLNKLVARAFVEDFLGKSDPSSVAPDATFHIAGGIGTIEGRADFVHFLDGLATAFPDRHFSLERLIAEADQVAVAYTLHGTHQAEFLGVPATGKAITMRSISVLRIENAQVIEELAVEDFLGLLNQLGATVRV
jgi:steroid delta-isomerase-like uncharacterized protein